MRKGRDEEMENGKWKKRTVEIAVHCCRASQPPERRLTGTPTACANYCIRPILEQSLVEEKMVLKHSKDTDNGLYPTKKRKKPSGYFLQRPFGNNNSSCSQKDD